MLRNLIFITAAFSTSICQATIEDHITLGLTPDRSTDWSLAGLEFEKPTIENQINFLEHGGDPTGKSDNAPALQTLIDNLKGSTIIYLPSGDYLFRSPITISPSNARDTLILRGQSSDDTRLIFETRNPGDHGLIAIVGEQTGNPIPLDYTPRLGDSSITLPKRHQLHQGVDAAISQQNDNEAMGTYLHEPADRQARHIDALNTWAARSVGQTLAIDYSTGKELKLRYPLTTDYAWGDVQIQPVRLSQNVGLENFSIVNRLEVDGLNSIAFHRAANCWIDNIRSSMTVRIHVSIRWSRNIDVRNSAFISSFRHGGGGHGYGVVCSKYTNHCLIENNAFTHLRHSMMVKEGANANVFGYNYSSGGYQEHSTHARDISIHGHYPYKNLFEGNIVEYAHSTDYWGAAGPGNTFFRNSIESAAIQFEDFSPKQNAIANDVLPIPESPSWLYHPESTVFKNHIVIGTEVIDPLVSSNRIQDSKTAIKLPRSLYLQESPSFWPNSMEWPPFGEGTTFGKNEIPAKSINTVVVRAISRLSSSRDQ